MAGNKTYARDAVRARLQQDLDVALRELYVDKRFSQAEIAAALGIPRSMVGRWLADYGITRDDRSELVL